MTRTGKLVVTAMCILGLGILGSAGTILTGAPPENAGKATAKMTAHPDFQTIARMIVNESVQVKEKEGVLISGDPSKVPLMEAVFKAAQEGKIRLEDEVILKGSDQVLGSGVLKSTPPGSQFTVGQLIELMIAKSDNTAANILIRLLGFDEANRYFQTSGLKRTRLNRTMMDFSKRKRGVENTTTAQDMALSLKRIYRHELISPEVSEICLGFLKRQAINDRIPARLPAGTVVAHKTGLERGVCHDAGIIFTENKDLLICVLTKNKSKRGSKPAKRFIAALAAHAYDYTIRAGDETGPGMR